MISSVVHIKVCLIFLFDENYYYGIFMRVDFLRVFV